MTEAIQPLDRIPPQSLDAERAVLGACLLDASALGIALEKLTPDDFYDVNHQATFEALAGLYAAHVPVDLVTFAEELRKRGLFEKLGGQPFLSSLVYGVPTTANIAYHADILAEKSTRRRLISAGSLIASLGYSEDALVPLLLDEAERAVFEVSQGTRKADFRSLKDVLNKTVARIEARCQQSGSEVSGFETGFTDLDRLLGGFQPGSLNIVAARPSMGKTAFALNIAQFGGAGSDAAVLIFSLEMSSEQLVERMLGAQAEVDIKAMNTGALGNRDWAELQEAAGALVPRNIFIDDSSMLTTMDFRSRCRRFKSKHHNLGLIVVDYLQLMSSGGRYADNRQQEVSDISRMLKGVARELDCPVLALSQLSRGAEKRENKKPVLSDLRDSGAIEQDADTVLLLFRADYYEESQPNKDSEALVTVAKNRNGPTDTVHLVFRRNITRFFSMKR